jgi:protein-disulfide isomerase
MIGRDRRLRALLETALLLCLVVCVATLLDRNASRRLAQARSPEPIAVHVEVVPDSVWKAVVSRGAAMGLPSASDTLVLFSDYDCPACSRASAVLDSLVVLRPNVRVLHRHFPLRKSAWGVEEAVAVECASRLGKAREGRRAMYALRGSAIDPEAVAGTVGIEARDFVGCWYGDSARAAVDTDLAFARSIGLDRTPSVFFAGSRWSHVPDLPELLRLTSESR